MRPGGRGALRRPHAVRDGWAPRWSADGAPRAFGSDGEGTDRLYVMPAMGGEPRRVSTEGTGGADVRTVEESPAWAPAGRRLAYVLRRSGEPARLVIADLSSGARTELRAPDGAAAAEPVWSPDGRWLAFSAARGGDSLVNQVLGFGVGGAGGHDQQQRNQSGTEQGSDSLRQHGSSPVFER